MPEVYLEERIPTHNEIISGIENIVRETAGYLLTTKKMDVQIAKRELKIRACKKMSLFGLADLCTIERKYAPYMNEVLSDQKVTPYVTTTETTNGISIRCDTEPNFKKNTVTVSLDGLCGTTFYQFEDYIAGEKTAVLGLKDDVKISENAKAQVLFYIAYLIRQKSWRYHYGRKLSEERLNKFMIPLPIKKDKKIDFEYIKELVENSYGWEVIEKGI